MRQRSSILGAALLVQGLVAMPLDAQLSMEQVRGTVVSLSGQTLTLKSPRGTVTSYRLVDRALARVREIRTGSQVQAVLEERDGQLVLTSFTSIVAPTTSPDRPTTGSSPPAPRKTRVLISTDRACEVSVDFRKEATLAAGGHTTLELSPGEHILSAVTADGATWREKVKVGGDQIVVEIVLGTAPAASPAELDRAAAQSWLALLDVRTNGRFAAAVVARTSFDFHDPDLTTGLHRAHGSLRRELERLARMPADGWRREAQQELARAGAAADRYVDLLAQAVTRAQSDNTVLGEAANLRAKALAEEPALAIAPTVMASLRASRDFEAAVPPDRRAEAGLPPHAQDFRLGAEYDQDSPPRLGLVDKGGLADGLGLQPGDRIISVDGKSVATGWDLKQSLRQSAGRKAQLVVDRKGKRRTLQASLPAALPS